MQTGDNSSQNDTARLAGDPHALFVMHAEMCQALANEHRLAIMYALKDGEMCVGDLAAALGITVHNVSQHLRTLRERMLVRARKEGQTVYYSVTNPKFVQACALIRQALMEEHTAQAQSLQAGLTEQDGAGPTGSTAP